MDAMINIAKEESYGLEISESMAKMSVVVRTNHNEEPVPYSYSKYEKYIGEMGVREGLHHGKGRKMQKPSYYPYKKATFNIMAHKDRIFRTNMPRVYFDQIVMAEETQPFRTQHSCLDIFSKYGIKTFGSKENSQNSLGIPKTENNGNDFKRSMSVDDLNLIVNTNPILPDEIPASTNFTSVGVNSRLSANNEADVSRVFQATYWH
jgi:hypothetical protein